VSEPPGAPGTPEGAAAPDAPASADRLTPLELFVYAPAGLLTTVGNLDELVAKGRTQIDGQIRTARVVGELAVTFARRDLQSRFSRLVGNRSGSGAPTGTTGPPQPAPAGPSHATPATPARAAAGSPDASPGPVDPGDPVDLAIPGYDTLSASQVVRRLDGLGPGELESVYRHESANRNRRTILHRAGQLLGTEDGGAAPSAPDVPTDPPA
jgi:hypothetical protein